jgi:hypothetical protein
MNGTFTCSSPAGLLVPADTYTVVQVAVSDRAGNWSVFEGAQLAGFPVAFVVN